MPRTPWLVESDKPSYQVLKWIGSGGFGQVFKVVRRGQVQMLRGAAEQFAESQIIEIGFQIAVALEFCHVLLMDPWNPITQRDVPDLVVADFGIASHVQTVGTRITGQRGTPGYEAPEIRGKGVAAAFSQKSDIYAFGCILYRLCSLTEPVIVDDIEAKHISMDYSMHLLSLISTMLRSDRDERPTASQVKDQLSVIARQLFQPKDITCRACQQSFASKSQLWKHVKATGHNRHEPCSSAPPTDGFQPESGFKVRGFADALAKYYYDDNDDEEEEEEEVQMPADPSPCFVCYKHFGSKRQFFGHLYGGHHYRGLKWVHKRKADAAMDMDVDRENGRVAKWVKQDLIRSEDLRE
ncbi:hypothetical protein ACEQ8H_002253 [Pleosporales sp. CAS-2024a]